MSCSDEQRRSRRLMPEIDLGGRTVAVREHGDGPAVILLHGASSHGGQWKWLGERLGDTCHVLAPASTAMAGATPFPAMASPTFGTTPRS